MINMKTAKPYAYSIIMIISLTGAIIFNYEIGNETISGLINGDDYVYYDPKQITSFLLIPFMVFGDLLALCVFLPCREKIGVYLNKLMIPLAIYIMATLVVGLLLSLAISIYPLGTDYYQCKSTSIMSSASHYAKSKAIYKQHEYHPERSDK